MSKQASLTKTSEKKGKGSISAKQKENTNQPMNSPAAQILNLQQTMGNQAVQRMIKSGTLHAKFKIGQPNDKYEQEADRVADRVMRMPKPQVQRQLVPGEEEKETVQTKPIAEQITPFVQRETLPGEEEQEEPPGEIQGMTLQRKEEELEEEPEQEISFQRKIDEEEKEETINAKFLDNPPLQRKEAAPEEEEVPDLQGKFIQRQDIKPGEEEEVPGFQAKLIQRQELKPEEEKDEPANIQPKRNTGSAPKITPSIASRISSLKGGGQPLSVSTRSYFEPRFGANFSQVRVHTGSQAAETAKSINAKAFTTGKDVVFGTNHYSPETFSGKHLLAHELAHVIQQGAAKHSQRQQFTSDTNHEIRRSSKGRKDIQSTIYMKEFSYLRAAPFVTDYYIIDRKRIYFSRDQAVKVLDRRGEWVEVKGQAFMRISKGRSESVGIKDGWIKQSWTTVFHPKEGPIQAFIPGNYKVRAFWYRRKRMLQNLRIVHLISGREVHGRIDMNSAREAIRLIRTEINLRKSQIHDFKIWRQKNWAKKKRLGWRGWRKAREKFFDHIKLEQEYRSSPFSAFWKRIYTLRQREKHLQKYLQLQFEPLAQLSLLFYRNLGEKILGFRRRYLRIEGRLKWWQKRLSILRAWKKRIERRLEKRDSIYFENLLKHIDKKLTDARYKSSELGAQWRKMWNQLSWMQDILASIRPVAGMYLPWMDRKKSFKKLPIGYSASFFNVLARNLYQVRRRLKRGERLIKPWRARLTLEQARKAMLDFRSDREAKKDAEKHENDRQLVWSIRRRLKQVGLPPSVTRWLEYILVYYSGIYYAPGGGAHGYWYDYKGRRQGDYRPPPPGVWRQRIRNYLTPFIKAAVCDQIAEISLYARGHLLDPGKAIKYKYRGLAGLVHYHMEQEEISRRQVDVSLENIASFGLLKSVGQLKPGAIIFETEWKSGKIRSINRPKISGIEYKTPKGQTIPLGKDAAPITEGNWTYGTRWSASKKYRMVMRWDKDGVYQKLKWTHARVVVTVRGGWVYYVDASFKAKSTGLNRSKIEQFTKGPKETKYYVGYVPTRERKEEDLKRWSQRAGEYEQEPGTIKKGSLILQSLLKWIVSRL